MSVCAVPIKNLRINDDHFSDKYLALMDHMRSGVQLDYLWQLEKFGSDPVFKFQHD
jgi:hypothetical protein